MTTPKHHIFNANSYISLSLTVVVIGGVWKVSGILNELKEKAQFNFTELREMVIEQKHQTELQRKDLERAMTEIDRRSNDRFTRTDMIRWTLDLKSSNTTIAVPPVKNE